MNDMEKNSHIVRQQQRDRSQFRAPPINAGRYVEENGSAPILATKRSAGVALKVNFVESVTYMPPKL